MKSFVIIGGGITGVTTAYVLANLGYDVTLIERHRYVGMETSFANGGQLSASGGFSDLRTSAFISINRSKIFLFIKIYVPYQRWYENLSVLRCLLYTAFMTEILKSTCWYHERITRLSFSEKVF